MGRVHYFISDIHLSSPASYNAVPPYFWLGADRAQLLARFVEEVVQDADAKGLHILGDCFDQWLLPHDVAPGPPGNADIRRETFAIFENPLYAPLRDSLARAANRAENFLHFTPGNHDMFFDKELLEALLPGAAFHPRGYFLENDTIFAEHGHDYSLANALENPWNGELSPDMCPPGFYITRTVTDAVSRGIPLGYEDNQRIMNALREEDSPETSLVRFFRLLTGEAKTRDRPIRMDGFGCRDCSFLPEEVETFFSDSWKNWNASKAARIPAVFAAICDYAYLSPAAFARRVGGTPEKVAIMGHTHRPALKPFRNRDREAFARILRAARTSPLPEDFINSIFTELGPYLEKTAPDPEAPRSGDYLYANCGTWISGESPSDPLPPATFVRVETNDSELRVELREYRGRLLDSPVLGEALTNASYS